MEERNRRILVQQQINKAEAFLLQADEMLSLCHWDLAVNRYYYSCFHIVQGLFIADGLSAHSHSGVVTQFSLNYVKTEKVETHYGSFLARLMQLRQKADYNCAYDISNEEAMDISPLAHNFVTEIKNLIRTI